MFDKVETLFNSANYGFMALAALAIVVVWFLPALLALIFNRKHVKYIAMACVPAGLSFVAWGAVLVWACTGKVASRFASKVAADKAV
ncbi:superinfection immunity protein [uncultured Ferrimonas sp.]|uniref:superinfection immunity protein n=1 Tax=uncultured Ferrimonas sp. TaxID=432640 RepID=UPI00262C917C|nr:superinfection immunity protein [uncultured Ferrimonas sp.]